MPSPSLIHDSEIAPDLDRIEPLLMRLRARDHVSEEEERALRWTIPQTRRIPSHSVIVHEGKELSYSALLIDGFMCRYKCLQEGERQIIELLVPGDFVDLHAFTLKRLDHDIMSLGPCIVGIAPHNRLQEIMKTYPHLIRLLWFTTSLDAAVQREWVLSLGRRSALSALAHLFCELHFRLELVRRVDPDLSFRLPLTQGDLADCLGLTPVHTSRTMKELRKAGLADFRSGRVTISDLQGLRALAEFDAQYLYPEHRPR